MKLISATIASLLLLTACGQTRSTEATGDAATITSDEYNFSLTNDEVSDLAEGLVQLEDLLVPDAEQTDEADLVEEAEARKPVVISELIAYNIFLADLEDAGVEITDEDTEEANAELAANIDASGQLTSDDFFALDSSYTRFIQDINTAQFVLLNQFTETAEVSGTCLSHILTSVEAQPDAETGVVPELSAEDQQALETEARSKIDEALARVQGGEDFAEVAIEVSEGPSGPDGGNLGCASTDNYVPEFKDAADSATVGEVTEPVLTQFGWHIILVREPTDEDQAELEASSRAQAGQQFGEEVNTKIASLTVEIDPEIGTWDTQTLSVIPASVETEVEPEVAEAPVEPTETADDSEQTETEDE